MGLTMVPVVLRRSLVAAALALLAVPSLPTVASAQDLVVRSREFVQRVTEEAVQKLADKSIPAAEREQRFRALFVQAFDVQAIGRFVVGAPNWRQASEAQRREYLALFEAAMVKTYSQRFADYSGETIQVTGARAEDTTLALVQMSVHTQSGPARVDWRVLQTDGGLKVVDLIIEGASLANSQREEFTSVIQRGGGGLDPLIAVLRQRVSG
ncbi:MAG: ABC transporter substrate-binding protein [Alphaproteobacteria bacterium]|nr:MAG: ABC transporter substrate-binding protein [Alphaproteobacteria bacterium]